MKVLQKGLALVVSWSLLFTAAAGVFAHTNQGDEQAAEPAAPAAKQSPEELHGLPLSRDFAAAGLRTADLLRDWQQHIAYTLQNGYPLSELSIAFDRDRAADALRSAELAASTDTDGAALEQLRNLFESLQRWSDNLVEEKRNMRLARYYMSPMALDDDAVFQKNAKCLRSITSMLASKRLADTASCE